MQNARVTRVVKIIPRPLGLKTRPVSTLAASIGSRKGRIVSMLWTSVCQGKSLEGLWSLTELFAICDKVPRFDEAASTKVLCLPVLRQGDIEAKELDEHNSPQASQGRKSPCKALARAASNYDSY
jgi:hypothetical protein